MSKTEEVKIIGKMVHSVIVSNIGTGIISLQETEDSVILANNNWPKRRAIFKVSCDSMYCFIEHWNYERNDWDSHSEMKAYQFTQRTVFLAGMLWSQLTD